MMIQSPSLTTCIPFDCFTPNPGSVSKDKIKPVIIDRFLRSQTDVDNPQGALSSDDLKTIKSRVTSKLFGRRSYQIVYPNQIASESVIFDWFISGKHGCKLHRRSVARSDMEVEAFLRKAGVDINRQDEKSGDTPLILASRAHDATLVEKLVVGGASIALKNKRGRDAIFVAVASINPSSYRSESLFDTVKCLLGCGADINQPITTSPRKTLADYAILRTELRTANLFISSSESLSGSLVLELASGKQEDNPDIIRSLASTTGFNPNIRNSREMTSLMLASAYGRSECLKALLEHPQTDLEATVVKPVQTFDKNWSAYSFAALNGFNDCTELLAEKGARKIVPSLTETEQCWLDQLATAKNKRDAAIALAPFALISPLAAIAIGGITGSLVADVQNIEANRPQSQLNTPPEE